MITLKHPHTGDVQHVAPEDLTPWMVQGYVQVFEPVTPAEEK